MNGQSDRLTTRKSDYYFDDQLHPDILLWATHLQTIHFQLCTFNFVLSTFVRIQEATNLKTCKLTLVPDSWSSTRNEYFVTLITVNMF